MPTELPPARQNHATYLGFDYGERNTGVAVGQRITGTARGIETLRSSNEDLLWSAVDRLVKTWEPSAFVVGMPYHPEEGVVNPIVQPILQFCKELERRYRRPVYTFDETLSTKESQQIFYDKRSKRSVQFADVKDELAAELILQTWLSHTAPREMLDA
jgi:putative Holliday junction resolvase